MKSLEIRSKSKEEAINKALVELNSKLEDLEIEVLESPTKGFLGFLGAKEGLYRFTVIEKETDIAKSFVKNILKNSNMRVLVDIEDYRSKREESLIRYAHKVAREVAKTKITKKLDYMNPYERRIIHSALQNDKYVSTYSEGTDPYRRLVIEYIK